MLLLFFFYLYFTNNAFQNFLFRTHSLNDKNNFNIAKYLPMSSSYYESMMREEAWIAISLVMFKLNNNVTNLHTSCEKCCIWHAYLPLQLFHQAIEYNTHFGNLSVEQSLSLSVSQQYFLHRVK